MAGRRRTGAFANTVSTLVLQDRERRFKEEADRRDFDRRLQEAGIKAGIETGQIAPQFEGGQFRGFGPGTAQPLLAPQLTGGPSLAPGGSGGANDLPEGTTITQTIKTPQGTITIKRGGVQSVKPPSEAEANRLLMGAQAGQPYPVDPQLRRAYVSAPLASDPNRQLERIVGTKGGLPSSPGGTQYLQQLINAGETESPAATFQRPQLVPPTATNALSQAGGQTNRVSPLLTAGLTPFRGLIQQLAPAFRGQQGSAGLPQDLPEPTDPSLSEDGVSTEGAQFQTADGAIYEIQNGQWVKIQ